MNTTKSFIRHTATLLSWLFHPVIMPLAAALILLYSHTYVSYLPPAVKSYDLLLVLLNTILIPMMYMFLLLRTGLITSFRLDSRKERIIPLTLYPVFTFITFMVMKKIHQPVIVFDLFLGITATALVTLLVTLRWKVSLHLAGMGAVSGFLFTASYRLGHELFLTWWLLTLVVSGFLATARMIHGSHTPAEVYVGFFLGFTAMSSVMIFL